MGKRNTIAKKCIIAAGSILYVGAIYILLQRIRQHPNLFFIDFGGQIASSQFFIDNGLHGRSLNWFQGIINNLFYPPLQDTIVSIIHYTTTLSTLYSFLTYLSLLIAGYFFVTLLIASSFKKRYSTAIYIFLAVVFFTINKFPNISYLQGLGVVDMIFSGLNSQVLGGLFLQLTIYEILNKKNTIRLILYAILGMLSHLVTGPVVVLLVFVYFALNNKKVLRSYIAIIMGVTAFFWLPFVFYKGSMSSTNVILKIPHIITFALLCALMFANKNTIIKTLCITGILILIPTEFVFLNNTFQWGITLPTFHYYRFGSVACLLAIACIGLSFDNITTLQFTKKTQYNTWIHTSILIISTGLFGYFTHGQRGDSWKPMLDTLGKPQIPTQQSLSGFEGLQKNRRIVTIDYPRPMEFALDALDQYQGYKNPFFKGLFWESNFSNQLITSYIANTVSPVNSVLYYHKVPNITYIQYTRIWEKLIDNYGVGYIVVAEPRKLRHFDRTIFNYLQSFLIKGTENITINPIKTMYINNTYYTTYEISEKPGGYVQPSWASIVNNTPKKITINPDEHLFTSKIIVDNILSGQFTSDFIVNEKQHASIPNITAGSGYITVEDIGNSSFKLTPHITSGNQAWMQVKINSLPGIRITNEQDLNIPTYIGPYAGYALVSNNTTYYLEYHRTYIMRISYVISILSVFYMVIFYKQQYQHSKDSL